MFRNSSKLRQLLAKEAMAVLPSVCVNVTDGPRLCTHTATITAEVHDLVTRDASA